MKSLSILLLVFSAIFTQHLAAQVDRNIGRSYSKPKKQKDTTDYLELSSQMLAESLQLDSFQQAVVKDLLKVNQAVQDNILAEDIPNESKTEKILALHEKFNGKVMEILTPEQAKKYEEMKEKKKKKK